MELQKLSPNPGNPRVVSDEQLTNLRKALREFGDLGGFVYNRRTKRLVSGHQRQKVFGKDAKVTIERKLAKPSPTGTVAEGFVILHGERFKYREVSWDEAKEKAAALAANKSAGEWDTLKLGEWLRELNDEGFDIDLTLFDSDERIKFLETPKPVKTKKGASSKDEPEEPEGKKVKKRVCCPECGHKFVPGWS